MSQVRPVQRVTRSVPTIEGAGVHLKRAFGHADPLLDPFLLLDDFHSDEPRNYLAGFPWHPHRGIETITYVLHGKIAHGDSLGNTGVIGPGDVQWMTAGGGIIHEEIPLAESKLLWGTQLWANLPASHKMMEPRYREVTSEQIPVLELAEGVTVRILCGACGGRQGPIQDIVTEPTYLDVTLASGAVLDHSVAPTHNVFAYVLAGRGRFGEDSHPRLDAEHLVVFGAGDRVRIEAVEGELRFLLVSGRPLREPVAWGGPIVMNTEEQLQTAFAEFRNGTFLKHR